jgi:hypothetical protein
LLPHLIGELEIGLLQVSHVLQRIERATTWESLPLGHHAQIHILLLRSLDLLLLLLQQLNLLLNRQLLH